MPETAPLDRRYRSPSLTLRGRDFVWGARTYLMGVINVTPDSFSGDGVGADPSRAADLAVEFEAAGADIIDIGAESSRPGGQEIDGDDERARLLPALERVRAATKVPISVDTWRATTASAALAAGADAVNDIHGLRRDPDMVEVLVRHRAPAVVMHNQRGLPVNDVAADIRAGFTASLDLAEAGGLDPRRLILDPGFGFGWTPAQNLEMIRRLPELWECELPLLIGVSRKSTLGAVLEAGVSERLEATIGAVAVAIACGADLVRVHDVRAVGRAVRVADAIVRGSWRVEE